MVNNKSYQGIERAEYPDWLGWFILDLLYENKGETEEHKNEIQVQLDYEVRDFYNNTRHVVNL